MTPEQRARAEFHTQGLEQGMAHHEAAQYADAWLSTFHGRCVVLRYAIADLRAALPDPGTWLWLRRHRRHGTGPILRRVANARALDREGFAVGEARTVVFYRCECRAVRRLDREPTARG